MAGGDSEETFKVTDRRRRADDTPDAGTTDRSTRAERPGPPTLSGLFLMLGDSAATAMGEAPDPVSGQVHRDLGPASAIIDLLVLLREKTEGHRTEEETAVLEGLVYDLQLRYVAATRRS